MCGIGRFDPIDVFHAAAILDGFTFCDVETRGFYLILFSLLHFLFEYYSF